MPRAIAPLSKAEFEKKLTGLDQKFAVGNGLHFHARGGSALWIFQYRDGASHRATSLGSYPELSLNAARIAREARRVALRSGSTVAAVPVAGERETFGDVLAAYLAEAGPAWQPHELKDWRSMFAKAPALTALAADDVRPLAIADAVKAAYPDSAKRQAKMRKRIATVSKFAETRHVKVTHAVVHHAAMKAADVPALMASLAGIDTATARALRFNILTAVRSGETLGATWEEITEIDGLPVWVIPAARMKARRDHRVPLSAAARAALGERGEGLIFRSRVGSHGRLGHSVMNDLLSELRPNVATVHGFRSTFRDWVGEATDYPRDLAEIALAHSLGNATEQAYARGDQLEKRRPLMNDWAAFATG